MFALSYQIRLAFLLHKGTEIGISPSFMLQGMKDAEDAVRIPSNSVYLQFIDCAGYAWGY